MSKSTDTNHEADMASELKSLKEDLMAVKQDIHNVTTGALQQGREVASHVKDQAAEQLDQHVKSTRDYVQKNPLTSTLVAAGVGIVAGVLLGRK